MFFSFRKSSLMHPCLSVSGKYAIFAIIIRGTIVRAAIKFRSPRDDRHESPLLFAEWCLRFSTCATTIMPLGGDYFPYRRVNNHNRRDCFPWCSRTAAQPRRGVGDGVNNYIERLTKTQVGCIKICNSIGGATKIIFAKETSFIF